MMSPLDPELRPDEIPPVPEPPAFWWTLTPGAALQDAYNSFEHGRDYYALDAEEPVGPGSDQLNDGTWSRLHDAYSAATRRAETARRLLEPASRKVIRVPPHVAAGRKAYEEEYRLWLQDELSLDVTGRSAPDLESSSASWYVYRAALLFAISRSLPGVQDVLVSEDGDTVTNVAYDDVVRQRVTTLLGCLARSGAGQAIPYLERVSRCYLLGLHEELAVMARSALDAFLGELCGMADEVGPRLGDLVSHAYRQGSISRGAMEAADRLRRAGNDAAHGRPLQRTPEQLLGDLAQAFESPGQDDGATS